MTHYIYKILTLPQWELFQSAQSFEGAPIDITDGYIHFSTADQCAQTASKHFAQHAFIIVARCGAAQFGDTLKWEVSRGGAMFPHLYGVLPLSAIDRYWTLEKTQSGFVFPHDMTTAL